MHEPQLFSCFAFTPQRREAPAQVMAMVANHVAKDEMNKDDSSRMLRVPAGVTDLEK